MKRILKQSKNTAEITASPGFGVECIDVFATVTTFFMPPGEQVKLSTPTATYTISSSDPLRNLPVISMETSKFYAYEDDTEHALPVIFGSQGTPETHVRIILSNVIITKDVGDVEVGIITEDVRNDTPAKNVLVLAKLTVAAAALAPSFTLGTPYAHYMLNANGEERKVITEINGSKFSAFRSFGGMLVPVQVYLYNRGEVISKDPHIAIIFDYQILGCSSVR